MNEKELRNRIGDLAYEVTQNAETEKPFSGRSEERRVGKECRL